MMTMTKDKQEDACQVKRIGEVVHKGADGLRIRVNERVIPIAEHKADPSLRIGDRVEWAGGVWRAVAEPL
jgi:hypothetical protein